MTEQNAISIQLMTDYLMSGQFRSLKLAEEKKKRVVLGVKRHLENSDFRRHNFHRHGLVAKFSVNRDYEWDYIGLNDYLNDVGLLIPVSTLLPDTQLKSLGVYEDIKDFELPRKTFTLKPTLNKEGKAFRDFDEEALNVYDKLNLDMLLNVFDSTRRELESFQEDYISLKDKIISCPVLQEKHKIKYEFGTLTLSKKKEGYDIEAIADNYGTDFLITYGKPDMNKLQPFILQGTISQREVYQFRKDVTDSDKEMKFTLMSLEDEQKQLQMLTSQSIRASLARDARMKA